MFVFTRSQTSFLIEILVTEVRLFAFHTKRIYEKKKYDLVKALWGLLKSWYKGCVYKRGDFHFFWPLFMGGDVLMIMLG